MTAGLHLLGRVASDAGAVRKRCQIPSSADAGRRRRALHFEIARGAPFVDDVRFDVRRLVGDDGSVLKSDCFTVTVK